MTRMAPYLDGLRAEDRAAMWRRGVVGWRSDQHVIVIEVGGDIVGFAVAGREADDLADGETGELYAINLEPDHWGKGLGRALLRHVTRGLADAGYRSAVLWVAPENERARGLAVCGPSGSALDGPHSTVRACVPARWR